MRECFPPRGLVFFWFLNDDCQAGKLRRQIRAFAEANVGAVVLHPRSGLLVPYGGRDWFELVRWLVDECVRAGVVPWLYDEDPYPSGSAGGWIAAERPDLVARGIERFEAPQGRAGEPFVFPAGKLVWAGLVPSAGSKQSPVDLTDAVGVVRRHWEVSPWDSRWYYPAAPRYDCPRSDAYYPEFALRRPHIPNGWKLVAFVARPVGRDSIWGSIADSLNPEATRIYISRTHEQYARWLGSRLGRDVPAIFTDEPKYHASVPWTEGLFENFADRYGYDLRPRLEHLFSPSRVPHAMLTRLHFREWCGRRFVEAWLKPVSDWCREHDLALVGHISPEDDPVQQAACVGNLLPLHRYFDLVGLDLIVPAVGDRRHAILNVGVTSAASAAQQMKKAGVLSETLGCSGLNPRMADVARILAWQVVSGVSTIVVHGAFASTLGLRKFDAPPDFGPDSPRWKGICEIGRDLEPFMAIARNVRQVAPVAILWPIRSFCADSTGWLAEDTGLRKDFNDLLLACLESQTGVHILDEEALWSATLDHGAPRSCEAEVRSRARTRGRARPPEPSLRIGRARYSVILVPSVSVLHRKTMDRLRELRRAGLPVYAAGREPRWTYDGREIRKRSERPWTPIAAGDLYAWCRARLPRFPPFPSHAPRELRVSVWGKGNLMAMNLSERDALLELAAGRIELRPGELIAVRAEPGGGPSVIRFSPKLTPEKGPVECRLVCCDWRVRWPDGGWERIERPAAAYQLRPLYRNPQALVPLTLTGASAITGLPSAEYLDYEAAIQVDATSSPSGTSGPPGRTVLILEPTAIRGRFTLSVGKSRWDLTVCDDDTKPVEVDISEVLRRGRNVLAFRFHQPMPFDGIKMAPVVIRRPD